MRGIVILALLIGCPGCIGAGQPAGQLGSELEALKRSFQLLEGELATRQGEAPGRQESSRDQREQGTPLVPQRPQTPEHALPSRFAPPMPGPLTIGTLERPALQVLATDLAGLEAVRAAEVVLDYGKTTTGLAKAAKALALMQPTVRGAIIRALRPAEIRTLLEMQVVDPAAPTPDTGPRAADAAAQPASKPAVTADEAPAEPRRFVVAGSGTDAWRTLLDTATGVVYNYRGETWVPITLPLLPKVRR